MGFTPAAALPPRSGGRRFAGGLILLGAMLSGLLALQSNQISPPLLSAAKSQRPEAQPMVPNNPAERERSIWRADRDAKTAAAKDKANHIGLPMPATLAPVPLQIDTIGIEIGATIDTTTRAMSYTEDQPGFLSADGSTWESLSFIVAGSEWPLISGSPSYYHVLILKIPPSSTAEVEHVLYMAEE